MVTGSSLWTGRGISQVLSLGLCLVLGCASLDPGTQQARANGSRDAAQTDWRVGKVLDTHTGRSVDTSEWLTSLGTADVIYIGEEHHNHEHINAALQVLQALVDQGRRPVIGMEMFSWDAQAALDRQVSNTPLPEAAFLEAAKWTQNWGGAYEDYAPLVRFAQEHRLPLWAWNPPRPLVRQVAREGLAQAWHDPQILDSGMVQDDIVDDEAYRSTIIGQLKACHGKGGDDTHYRMMYEASLFRDEAMAKTLVKAHAAIMAQGDRPAGPIVSYTGGGHIQYRLPIPQRVTRRVGEDVKQVTISLASFEPERIEELKEWMSRGIADFIWLTGVGAHGPPRRC